jgi:hypothetical protein
MSFGNFLGPGYVDGSVWLFYFFQSGSAKVVEGIVLLETNIWSTEAMVWVLFIFYSYCYVCHEFVLTLIKHLFWILSLFLLKDKLELPVPFREYCERNNWTRDKCSYSLQVVVEGR